MVFESLEGYGYDTDTLVANDSAITYRYLDDFDLFENKETKLYVGLEGFQIYNPINFNAGCSFDSWNSTYYREGNLRLFQNRFLGLTGSATRSMFFFYGDQSGVGLGANSFSAYNYRMNSTKYYQVGSPFTELYYVTGSKKEQVLKVIHAQQVSKNLNVGISLQKVNMTGYYVHQKTNHTSFSTQLDYGSSNNRYQLLVNGIWNSNNAKENGGLTDDGLFEDTASITKNTIEVFLDSAENTRKGNDYFLKQYFALGKINNTKQDSSEAAFHPTSHLYHSFHYLTRSNTYADYLPNPDFYTAFYNDSGSTSDQLNFLKVKNSLGWSYLPALDSDSLASPPIIGVELAYEYAEYHQATLDSFMNNAMASVKIVKENAGRFSYSLLGDFFWFGPNQGDYTASIRGTLQPMGSVGKISFLASIKENSPKLFHSAYASNHYNWNNQFDKINVASAIIDYSHGGIKFNIGAGAQLLTNFIYYDTLAIPTQYGGSFPVLSFYFAKDFNLGKFQLNNRVSIQHITEEMPVRVPNLITYNSFYYGDWIFKKALYIQFGADIWYNTSYYADAYMPVTGDFYNQNSKAIGNYPYVDAFVNFKIKNARIFLKLAHLNSGLMGNRYYMVPHYPMYDRSFKFGISWIFHD